MSSMQRDSTDQCPLSKVTTTTTTKLPIESWLVELKSNPNPEHNLSILSTLISNITISTGFSSIPESLKQLTPHYGEFKDLYERKEDPDVRKHLASVVSFIATSHPANSAGDVLEYFLRGHQANVSVWGIAYVRELTRDIVCKFKQTSLDSSSKETLVKLMKESADYFIEQNSELEACDMLIETEQLNLLETLGLEEKCDKVCDYISACSVYLQEPENRNILRVALSLCLKYKRYIEAFFFALLLQDWKFIQKLFTICDPLIQKQMALILASHNKSFPVKEDTISEIMTNSHISRYFISVARQLDVLEPKSPDDILKDQKLNLSVESVLGTTFLNCFVNACFGTDKLLLNATGMNWICRHTELGKLSTTASLGLICLWDLDGGLNKIDRFLYSTDHFIKAGALVACGIVTSTVRSEFEPVLLILRDHLDSKIEVIQLGSVMGLALAYVATNHTAVLECVSKLMPNDKSGMAALATGFISCGAMNGSLLSSLVRLIAYGQLELANKCTRNVLHAIGLCVMGSRERTTLLTSVVDLIQSKYVKRYLQICITLCAYVGSSDMLKIQELINLCTEIENEKLKGEVKGKQSLHRSASVASIHDGEIGDEDWIQMISILGIAMISLGNEVNSEMIVRTFGHFLRVGHSHIKRAAVLAIALIYTSNPKSNIIELLSKHSHSFDLNLALDSIFALGFVGAGSNNARVSQLLANLSDFHSARPQCRFAVKVAQGLLHLGKGLLTLSPQMEGRLLLRHTSLSGLLITLIELLEPLSLIKHHHHHLLFLSCAIRPKILLTLDQELNSISTTVRIGQQVDTIGQAGTPRSITGFQTLCTPILINQGEKAELATDDYIPINNHLEGCVILKANPNKSH